jgi:hypothetical protein
MKPMNFGGGSVGGNGVGENRNTNSAQSQNKGLETKIDHIYDSKIVGLWKRAINTIIFKQIIKQYAPILIELGVDLDSDSEDDDDDDDDAEQNESIVEEVNKLKEPNKQVLS